MSETVWICARCNRKQPGNPSRCPWCGHTVYRPEYPEPVSEAVATEHPMEAEEGWLGFTDAEDFPRRLADEGEVSIPLQSPKAVTWVEQMERMRKSREHHDRHYDVLLHVLRARKAEGGPAGRMAGFKLWQMGEGERVCL